MECLGHGNRYKDHYGLLSALDIDFPGRRDLKLSQLALEVGDIDFKVEESLSDLLLNLRGGGTRSVGGPLDLVLPGHFADGECGDGGGLMSSTHKAKEAC